MLTTRAITCAYLGTGVQKLPDMVVAITSAQNRHAALVTSMITDLGRQEKLDRLASGLAVSLKQQVDLRWEFAVEMLREVVRAGANTNAVSVDCLMAQAVALQLVLQVLPGCSVWLVTPY